MPTLNLNEATKLYYGNTEAQKLYKGSELLYPKFSLLGLSPALWLDADDNSTITLVSGVVSEWRDKSGNLRHATQATAGNRPLLVANGLNGTDVIRFNGSNNFLKFSVQLFSNSLFSIFCILKAPPQTNTAILAQHSGLANVGRTVWGCDDNGRFRLFFNNGSSYTLSSQANRINNTPNLYYWESDGSGNSQLLYNGILDSSLNNQSWTPYSMNTLLGCIGSTSYSDFFYFGDISQVIIFPRVLTQTEREKVEGYLAHKTGLQANLPSNHPYKTLAP